MESNTSSRVRWTLRLVLSAFSDEKKLSIATLSQTLPARLIEQVMALSAFVPHGGCRQSSRRNDGYRGAAGC